MAGTYSQVLLHLVFSTKHREPIIVPEIADRLYSYLGGIVRSEKGILVEAGGMPDHIHLLLGLKPDVAISTLVRNLKSNSSKWIKDTFSSIDNFAWQEGYGVFSVSKSNTQAVTTYIQNQAEHHLKDDFRSEYLKLLRAHGIDFDERYVFD